MGFLSISVPDRSYKWWALGATTIGCFMSILDTSIVNIALPTMMTAFSVDTDSAEWILTAYMLTMGVLQPATGYFCDVFGTRRMYLFSLALFTAGSALCGSAWSNDSMIFFRVIQAMGGGLIIPVSMAIVYQVFPPAERNMAMGIWGISAMVAPAVGPTLSGYLVEYWDWRLIFTVNIPVGIIGYLLASMVLRETPLLANRRFDIAGFLTSSVGLFCLLLALSKGTDEGWTSAYIMSLFYVASFCLTMFVFIELEQENPILDLTLFKDWNFAFSNIVLFLGTIGLFGGIFLIPLFMQNLMDYSAIQTGILMFPAAASSGLMMPIAGRLADKFGAKPVVLTGMALLTLSSLYLTVVDLDVAYERLAWIMMLRGIGLGMSMMPVTVLGMHGVPLPKISRASSLINAVRQVSGSLGIAILGTVLQNRQIYHLYHMAESQNIASLATAKMLAHGEQMFIGRGDVPGVAHLKALALLSGIVQRQAAVFSFDDAFLIMALICGLAIIPSLALRSVKAKAGMEKTVMAE